MLLIITGSNYAFTPGYWQGSLKQADNGVPFFLTANRNSEISLSDSCACGMSQTCFFPQVLGEVFAAVVAGGNFELPLGYSEVLQSLHLFNEKHNSPLIAPSCFAIFFLSGFCSHNENR